MSTANEDLSNLIFHVGVSITDLVKERRVKFDFYRAGVLYYSVIGTNFVFPVPIEDTDDAVFLYEDKAIIFMRWIRKQMKVIEDQHKLMLELKDEFERNEMNKKVDEAIKGLAVTFKNKPRIPTEVAHFDGDGTHARTGVESKVIELPHAPGTLFTKSDKSHPLA